MSVREQIVSAVVGVLVLLATRLIDRYLAKPTEHSENSDRPTPPPPPAEQGSTADV